ncbi:MAG: hypothetical protein U1E33_04060 [Rhodospirillales bacterium]
MIFLDTNSATASEWVRKEIEIANALAIGVLQVIFPRPPAPDGRLDRARFTELCEPLSRTRLILTDRTWRSDVVTRIALRVEAAAARRRAGPG